MGVGAVAEGRAAQPFLPSLVGAAEAPEPQVNRTPIWVCLVPSLVLLLLSSCATRTEVALRERAQRAEARVVEAERYIAGVQDDNAMLQKALIEQANYIRQLERGAIWQANEMARIVDTCEL